MPPEHDKARKAAAKALVRVHKGGWTSLAADSALAAPALSPRDRAFAGALFYGSVERLVTLDFLLMPLLNRPLHKLDTEVRAVLETGLYQLLYMRVPQSAAVNESVKLARAMGKSSAAGMVNAVLRKAAAAPWAAAPGSGKGPDLSGIPFADEAEWVRVAWSVGPAVAAAVMEALPDDYDAFFAASFGGLDADGAARGECLRANTLRTNAAALAEGLRAEGAEVHSGQLENALYARFAGPVGESPLFKAGHCHVQGEASQYACACLAARPGMKVLDLCAAPGGKAATLAQALGGGEGLTACDVSEARLPLLRETLEWLGITGARVLQNDATVYNPSLEGQDRVLCDVPCSSLGVLAQKPDLRFTDGANFETLPALQLKVLATASRYVKEGGRLVYATCTVRRAENEGVVRAFLTENGSFRLISPPTAPRGAVIHDDMMTILPQNAQMDGFFVATLEKV